MLLPHPSSRLSWVVIPWWALRSFQLPCSNPSVRFERKVKGTMCSHLPLGLAPIQRYLAGNTSHASILEKIIAWDSFRLSVQCDRYKIIALQPFFTTFKLTLSISKLSKIDAGSVHVFWTSEVFIKAIFSPKFSTAQLMFAEERTTQKRNQRFHGLFCSSKTQNAHTDGDSKTLSRLANGLFAASATWSKLPPYHFALPNKTAERSYVRLETFEYGFHGLFPLA